MYDRSVTAPLSRAEYDRMVERGVFDHERVELLRGEVVAMSPQGPLHADIIERLQVALWRALRGRARVRSQSPLALSSASEPEPDVIVFRAGDYAAQHPQTALLVIEVANTSLDTDRGFKAALYAEAGIPEYWIVNLVDRVVEVYTAPGNDRYREVVTKQPGQTLSLAEFPDIAISLAGMWAD